MPLGYAVDFFSQDGRAHEMRLVFFLASKVYTQGARSEERAPYVKLRPAQLNYATDSAALHLERQEPRPTA